MDRYVTYTPAQCAKKGNASIAGITAALVLLGSMSTAQAIDTATADLNDNGRVDIFDLRKLLRQRGLEAGELGYREGLDVVPDSIIDTKDIIAVRQKYRQLASTTNTTLSGRIFDIFLNPLEGVKVFVGSMTIEALLTSPCAAPLCAVTNEAGQYSLNVPDASTGETAISFVGNAVVDATPGELSGQFATVPFKPIFINGGKDNTFRDMIVPERNLVGSTDLTTTTATDNGGNSFTLNDPLVVGDPNGLAILTIPVGCTVAVPVGELPIVSYTAVPTDTLPVATAPGLISNTAGTFQPAETLVTCPSGQLLIEIDNLDAYNITPPAPLSLEEESRRPMLMGVADGVYQELTRCDVIDVGSDGLDGDVKDVIRCEPPSPYLFAWHEGNCDPRNPNRGTQCAECPTTDIIGTVVDAVTMAPIIGATVTVAGKAPILTDASGDFTVLGVVGGPAGDRCFQGIGRFNTRVTATGIATPGPDTSLSGRAATVPGGVTNVGTIFLGDDKGTVQGEALLLSRIKPILVSPLAGASVVLSPGGFSTALDSNGNYNITNINFGSKFLVFNFTGDVTLPGRIDEDPVDGIDNDLDGIIDEDPVNGMDDDVPPDSVVSKTIMGGRSIFINSANVPSIRNFRATGTGTISVTFNNVPMGFTFGRARFDGGVFGDGTFVIQAASDDSPVDDSEDGGGLPSNSTTIVFTDVPMGPCKLSIVDDVNDMEREAYNEANGCFINEDGQVLNIEVDAGNYAPSLPKDFSGAFTFFAIGSIGLTAVARRRRKA